MATSSQYFGNITSGTQSYRTGEVISAIGKTVADGFLPCDGSVYLKSAYPALATACANVMLDYSPTWKNYATPDIFTSIAWANGIYVASVYIVASHTIYYTSPDAITWTARSFPASIIYDQILVANNRFFIVSNSSGYTSLDGINWTTMINPPSGNVANTSMYYGDETYVYSTSYSTTIYKSVDGITWTTTIDNSSYPHSRNLVYNSRLKYWLGSTNKLGTMMYSMDLNTFNNITHTGLFPGSTNLKLISYDSNIYMIDGYIYKLIPDSTTTPSLSSGFLTAGYVSAGCADQALNGIVVSYVDGSIFDCKIELTSRKKATLLFNFSNSNFHIAYNTITSELVAPATTAFVMKLGASYDSTTQFQVPQIKNSFIKI